jgi:hypothetical protein
VLLLQVYKMVMSIGWNPFYNNTEKTAEPWLLHDFDQVGGSHVLQATQQKPDSECSSVLGAAGVDCASALLAELLMLLRCGALHVARLAMQTLLQLSPRHGAQLVAPGQNTHHTFPANFFCQDLLTSGCNLRV